MDQDAGNASKNIKSSLKKLVNEETLEIPALEKVVKQSEKLDQFGKIKDKKRAKLSLETAKLIKETTNAFLKKKGKLTEKVRKFARMHFSLIGSLNIFLYY